MRNKYWTSLALLCTASVVFLSLYEFQSLPKVAIKSPDKYVHVCMYFALCFTWWMAIRPKRLLHQFSLWVLIFSLGGILELLQEYATVKRGYDTYDLLANGAGALLAWLLLRTVQSFCNKTR